jgi:hypothetical protein
MRCRRSCFVRGQRVSATWQREDGGVVSRRPPRRKLYPPVASLALHVIASCTDRKRLRAPAALRLGNLRESAGSDRFAAWWRALQRDGSPTRTAAELYAGDHWTVLRELPALGAKAGLVVRLWVASAGYGLVPGAAPLRSYAATFTPGHADSVVTSGATARDEARDWWQRLGREVGPDPSAPRTVAALARAHPGETFLVVAAPRYVAAMEADLAEALGHLRSKEKLVIVSGMPGPTTEALRANWVPSVAALQSVLGGARTSLHARVARRIVDEAAERGIAATAVRERFQNLARQAPPLPVYDRTAVEDDAVRRFVLDELRENPRATHTRLLRDFRASGHACEQSRFRRIFQETPRR